MLPYHGDRLRGNEIRRRVDAWVDAGVVEPTVADAVEEVLANPDWLRLEGHTVAVLGAGAEMGPLPSLMRWGARVAAVDLDRPAIWERRAGRWPGRAQGRWSCRSAAEPTRHRSRRSPGSTCWPRCPPSSAGSQEQPGTLVIGNYVYADGATNTRVSVAVDELTTRLQASRDDVALAFLATPTDVFAVPARRWTTRPAPTTAARGASKTLGRPLRALSGGRLLRRNYVAGLRPRHQRLAGAAAGTELRAGQAAAALARDRRPPRRARPSR